MDHVTAHGCDAMDYIFGDHAAPGALVFTRFSAIFIAAPILGGVPFQVKALISLALTVAES